MALLKKLLRYQKEYGTKYLLKKVFFRYCIKYRLGKQYFPVKITKEKRTKQENWKPGQPIKISIAVPLYNTPPAYLRELIESVREQTYSCWELCLADASGEICRRQIFDIVQEYSAEDKRIRYRELPCNDGIAGNTNQAIKMCTGHYIALADHDDILHPSALYYVMQEIIRHQADFIYTDELSFVKKPSCVQSIHFKNDFSKESFRNNNYICHFTVFHRTLWDATGGFRREFDGSQDYDLFLRLTEQAERICHVPKVLYFWRCHSGSVASQVGAKPYTIEAGRKALQEHLKRVGLAAEVTASEYGTFYHVHYQLPEENKILLLTESDTMAKKFRQQIQAQTGNLSCVPEVRDIREISESDAALWAGCDMVVLMRDGYRPMQAVGQWLETLLECLQPEENFAASPVSYDQKGKIYFSGYCYDKEFPEKIRPIYRGMPGKDPGYMNRAAFRQTVSLLGGAALAVRGNILGQIFQKWKKEESMDFFEKEYMEAIKKKIFSDSIWFSICMEIRELQGKCIVTPDASFQCDIIQDREYQPDICIWEKQEWKKFQVTWRKYLEASDPNMNPWMSIFGKYYFLW